MATTTERPGGGWTGGGRLVLRPGTSANVYRRPGGEHVGRITNRGKCECVVEIEGDELFAVVAWRDWNETGEAGTEGGGA